MGPVPPQEALRQGPGLLVRLFVVTFLVAVVGTALLQVEAWPFTGWKLFSQVRTATAWGWDVERVDGAGHEHPAHLGRLPRGYHGTLHVLNGMAQLSASQRRKVCRAWAGALHDHGLDVRGVRIYRTSTTVHLGDHGRPSTRRVRLQWECGEVFGL